MKKKIIVGYAFFILLLVSSFSSTSMHISESSNSDETDGYEEIQLCESSESAVYFIETAANCNWGQGYGGFNDLLEAVLDNQGFNVKDDSDKVPLGCTAVSLGIMMRSLEWPLSSRSIPDWEDDELRGIDFVHTVPSSVWNEDQNYDYSDMDLDGWSNQEIEEFLYHIAVSIKMNWGWLGGNNYYGCCLLTRQGSAYNSERFDQYWRYRTPVNYDSTKQDVIESIKWGLPVPFGIPEHTPIFAGYDSGTDQFFINWGWRDQACGGENDWYDYPYAPVPLSCNNSNKRGPIGSCVPYCSPEHWVFAKSGCSGDHDGTAKEPYDNLKDALDWINSDVLSTYDHGVVNLWTGTYESNGIINTPCEIRAINGDVIITGGDDDDPPDSCFPAGTKITMADGSYKNIEDVEIGDKILSYDVDKKEFTSWTVRVLESPSHPYYCINDGLICPSNAHHFYLKKEDGSTGWGSILKVGNNAMRLNGEHLQIRQGDYLFTREGNWISINSITYNPEETRLYNILSYTGNKNYYANDILVYEDFIKLPYLINCYLKTSPNPIIDLLHLFRDSDYKFFP